MVWWSSEFFILKELEFLHSRSIMGSKTLPCLRSLGLGSNSSSDFEAFKDFEAFETLIKMAKWVNAVLASSHDHIKLPSKHHWEPPEVLNRSPITKDTQRSHIETGRRDRNVKRAGLTSTCGGWESGGILWLWRSAQRSERSQPHTGLSISGFHCQEEKSP